LRHIGRAFFTVHLPSSPFSQIVDSKIVDSNRTYNLLSFPLFFANVIVLKKGTIPMRELSIESNGSLEKTAVYLNGEQLGGIHQMMLHISEDGDFDTILVYEGTDKQMYTKHLFTDYLDNIKKVPPTFTEEEAEFLRLLTITSDGNLENTMVYINDEPQDGIVDLIIQIQRGTPAQRGGIGAMFKKQQDTGERPVFRAEIQYRNEDGSISTEQIFG
jgi:hypothetical protein